jgi:hypothetical protein
MQIKSEKQETDEISYDSESEYDFTIVSSNLGRFNIRWKNGKKEVVTGIRLNELKNDFTWNADIKPLNTKTKKF